MKENNSQNETMAYFEKANKGLVDEYTKKMANLQRQKNALTKMNAWSPAHEKQLQFYENQINKYQNMKYAPNDPKQKQLDVILKSNPMTDMYHQGIRSREDIKTFEEAMSDKESFAYGDYSLDDAKRDLKRGKVMVHSSKPLSPGGFVSTSKNMAADYAGSGKLYSQEVDLSDIAWINGDEGQYTKE